MEIMTGISSSWRFARGKNSWELGDKLEGRGRPIPSSFPQMRESGDWTFCNRHGAEESSVRGEMRLKLTFRWQKVNETCASSSMV